MPNETANIRIKKINNPTDNLDYYLAAKTLLDSNDNEVTWQDLIEKHMEIVVVNSLPTASADTLGKLYLVPNSGTGTNTKDEYVTVKSGSIGSYTYTWEKLGTTDVDLSNYSQNTHTHTVTPDSTKLSVEISTNAEVGASGTEEVLTGVEVTAQPTVALSTGATAGAGVIEVSTGITSAATETNSKDEINAIVDIDPSEDTFVKAVAVTADPTIAMFTNATNDTGLVGVLTAVNATTTNIQATATGTNVGASTTDNFVRSYEGETNKLVTASITGVANTVNVAKVNTAGSVVAGSAPTWNAVLNNEVLEFSFSAGTTPSTVTLPTFDTETVAVADANATTVATGALASDGAGATIMTGLGNANTASAVTGVEVTAQPTITLATGATAGAGVIEVATGVSDTATYIGATASGTTVGVSSSANAIIGLNSNKSAVLGSNATFTTNVVPTTTNIKATASGTTVNATGTANVVTNVTITTQPAFTVVSNATVGDVTVAVANNVSTSQAVNNSL